MEVRPGYTQTEAGAIPGDWRVEALGSAGRWFSGGTPSMANELFWTGPIPWVSAKDMKVSRLHDSILHVSEKAIGNGTRLAPTGAVLLVVRGMILAHTLPVALVSRPVAFNQDLKALVPRGDVDGEFMLLWLQANAQQILGIASESTHGTKRIPSDDLFARKVALPPLPEQRAIAAALSDVDALLGGLDRLIAKKRDLKQAAMQQLLTGQTRLPGFRGEWEVRRLGDMAPLQRGFDLPSSELRRGPFPVVYSNGVLNFHAHFQVEGPGVITGRSGTIGKVTFVEGPYWPHNTALWVTSFKKNDARFIFYLYTRVGFERFATGSGVPTLNRNDVHAVEVVIPPTKAEQSAIATVLSDMDTELSALEARRTKTRALKQAMMQALLTGKIRLV